MKSNVKQWIELASIPITIVVTGQEDNKDRENDKHAEEYSKAEEAFVNNQTGQCGVSNGGIGVPGTEDHYSNPPSVSSYHMLDFALNLIHPLALNPTHLHSKAISPLS